MRCVWRWPGLQGNYRQHCYDEDVDYAEQTAAADVCEKVDDDENDIEKVEDANVEET